MYSAPESRPPHATAPGRFFCGSLISSPMMEASYRPTKPKQITAKELSTNCGFYGILKFAEDFLCPEVYATFAGIALREFDHCNALWPEKQDQRNDPKPDRDAAISRDGWKNIEVKDGDDEKQH